MTVIGKPIRVLHVVQQMDQGGIQNFIMNLYRSINREKVQFDFLKHTTEEGVFDEEIKSLGGRIYTVLPYTSSTLISGTYLKSINQFFFDSEYDIVHSHVNAMNGFILEAAYKNKVKNRISHSHTYYRFGYDQNILKSSIKAYSKKLISQYATARFACSQKAGQWLYGSSNLDDFEVINNGINTQKYKFSSQRREVIRKQLEIPKNSFVIGNIGRLTKQKNQEFLINIFYQLKKLKKDSKLILIGDGKLRTGLEKLVVKKDLQDDVLFLGIRTDIPDLLMAMDTFVFPSHNEGLGIVLVEAQASGLNCIAAKNNVPLEANITNRVTYLSLSSGSKKWASYLYLSCLENERESAYSKVEEKGYDILQSAQKLEKYYLNL